MRIDIERSHQRIDSLIVEKKSIKKSMLLNKISYVCSALIQKSQMQDIFTFSGISRSWFNDFLDYWKNILGGRPLSKMDFFMLLHDYRKSQQQTKELNWDTPSSHLLNWQDPNQLYLTFAYTRSSAFFPILGRPFWKSLAKNAEVLEYGCSLAPYYNCYRKYFSNMVCAWTLADIANFPFHYAKYLYRKDKEASFYTIRPDNFKDPLKSKKMYDAIILTTVLEHLDDPAYISEYLLDRLKKNGLFVFDFIISEGKGLDTPFALSARQSCLNLIKSKIKIIFGKIEPNKDVGLVVGRRL